MIRIKELDDRGTYEVHLSGKIRENDYEDVLIPALDKAIETHERIRALVIMDDDIEYSIGAILDDAQFGLRNWNGFDRIAVVVNPGWMNRAVRGIAPLMPCPVETFRHAEADDARRWLSESLGSIHQTDLGNGVLHVELLGKLDAAVYAEEERDMDAFVRRNDRFRLLLDVRDFDGWQGLAAVGRHLKLVRNHYHLIDRAAVVGDTSWQRMGERLLGALSGAETRYFDAGKLDEAKAWIAA